MRQPPRSPLFPYTTLFRSRDRRRHRPGRSREPRLRAGHAGRSEEHTSELQSRVDLVCRLLLEKKNRSAEAVVAEGRAEVLVDRDGIVDDVVRRAMGPYLAV